MKTKIYKLRKMKTSGNIINFFKLNTHKNKKNDAGNQICHFFFHRKKGEKKT